MRMFGAGRARLLGAAFVAAMIAVPAAAQVLPSRQELDPARQPALPAAPRGDLFRQMEAGPCPFAQSDLKVTLTSVEFRGSREGALALGPDALAPAYADLIGREVPLATICEIRDRAAVLYMRQGVLASVTIPEQRISEGRLVLQVVEAQVVGVRYSGNAGPAQRQVARYLNKLQGLAPFDLDVAQRYLLLASDVPGVRIQATLKPAPQGNGAVELDVAISRSPVSSAFAVQNHGSVAIGRVLGTVRSDFNSFTPLGERTSIVGYGTLGSAEQRVFQVMERVNLGGEGLALQGSLAWARTKPGDVLAPLGLLGNSFAGNAELTYPILRHRRHNLLASAGIDVVDQKVDLFGGLAALTEDRLRVLYAKLDGHWAPRDLADRSVVLTGSLELRQGVQGLGASPYLSGLASRFGGRPDATVVRAELAVGGLIAGPIVGTASALWQHTDRPLLSYEEYSAGNFGLGRGYDPSSASGDRAIGGSLELTTIPLVTERYPTVAVRPYAFYDVVRLTNLAPTADRTKLRSVGLGLRIQSPIFAFDAAWAKPLDPVAPVFPKPPGRLLLSISASIQ
jgi:hemolysin activation/secretion protein